VNNNDQMAVAIYRRMLSRDTDEEHRASTPLELFFDLCFVVAVAQASGRLHHALLSDNGIGHGVGNFLMVFFAIWWAWMNFTWFASAYDTDDALYRAATLVQITGALILAAGIPRAFDDSNFAVVVIGYVVMRLAMVAQWLRAARSDELHRQTAIRFAIGVGGVQVAWVARLWLPDSLGVINLGVASFLVLVVAEVLVPVIAERAGGTTWHPGHIAERYGLFTLIVLGESILAATTAVQTAFDAPSHGGGHRDSLLILTAAGLVIVFGMWWIYFDQPGDEVLSAASSGFVWGYGHYLIFAAAAAVGAGIATNVDVDSVDTTEGIADLSARSAGFAIAIPVAVYLVSVWWLHSRPAHRDESAWTLRAWAIPAGAVLVLVAPLLGVRITVAIPIIAAILAALVVVKTIAGQTTPTV
jgi:low temperature requirement protein LtrA